MLDLKEIRTNADGVKAALTRRSVERFILKDIDKAVAIDESRRSTIREAEQLRAEINRISADVGVMMREGKQSEAFDLRVRSRMLHDEVSALETEIRMNELQIRDILLCTPNIPADDCPYGKSEKDNVVMRVSGYDESAYMGHHRVPHYDVGEALGILDMPRAVRMSGAMFAMFRGLGARLVRALVDYGLDRNRDAYEEVRPPTLVQTDTMIGTGHLPRFLNEAYQIQHDYLWAIPTSEVPLTSMLAGEIVDESELPMRLMAHTSCFRREAGAAGSKTRGLLRLHEFDKVELYAFCTPSQASSVHADILQRAESAIADLGLSYRVLDLCTSDLGLASARTFDIEVYAPGVGRWLEVSSVSWCSDYQARRANIRYRPKRSTQVGQGEQVGQCEQGGQGEAATQNKTAHKNATQNNDVQNKPTQDKATQNKPTQDKATRMVHTLNGSGLAVPRVWAAIVETYRNRDGSVTVPEVLRPYMGGVTTIR